MSTNISEKTLQDLEFSTVLQHITEHCISSLGREKVAQIQPVPNKEELFSELNLVNEYLSSFISENTDKSNGCTL